MKIVKSITESIAAVPSVVLIVLAVITLIVRGESESLQVNRARW